MTEPFHARHFLRRKWKPTPWQLFHSPAQTGNSPNGCLSTKNVETNCGKFFQKNITWPQKGIDDGCVLNMDVPKIIRRAEETRPKRAYSDCFPVGARIFKWVRESTAVTEAGTQSHIALEGRSTHWKALGTGVLTVVWCHEVEDKTVWNCVAWICAAYCVPLCLQKAIQSMDRWINKAVSKCFRLYSFSSLPCPSSLKIRNCLQS